MMLKDLQKNLKLHSNNKEIFDITIYGSSVKGKTKPNDIDIAVIFYNSNLKERLEKIQEIKFSIKKNNPLLNIDIKSMNLSEFLDANNLSRTGIITEGISIKENKPICELIGFKAFTIFSYNLKKQTHTEKIKFNYALKGRNSKGTLKSLDGQTVGLGVVKIPIKNTETFKEFLTIQKVEYKKSTILESF